jgi:hypothetical protein
MTAGDEPSGCSSISRWLDALHEGRHEAMCALSDPASLDRVGGCGRLSELLEEALEHADATGAMFEAAPHRPADGVLFIGRLVIRFGVPVVEDDGVERVVFDVSGRPG